MNTPKKKRSKKASEIFRPVDPDLKIIDRGTLRRSKKQNWNDSGGSFCPRCGKEAVRFRPKDGVCMECVKEEDTLTEDEIVEKTQRTYIRERLKRGDISISDLKNL